MKQTLNLALGALISLFVVATAMAHSGHRHDEDFQEYWSQHGESGGVDHGAWTKILQEYIEDDNGLHLFRYGDVTAEDRHLIERYIDGLVQVTVTELGKDEQFAYWVNLYNAVTIKVIIDHYPLESIRDISFGFLSLGPWKEKLVEVEGFELSLDDIEHKILRPIFADNRVHYAVNCASMGCPNLQDTAFSAESLEEMLDEAARQYVNHPRGVEVVGGEVIASKIYSWYSEDFGEEEEEIIEHLVQYADSALAAQLMEFDEIEDYRYDWALNE